MRLPIQLLTEEGLPIYREEVAQLKPKRKKVQRRASLQQSAPRSKSQVAKKTRPKKKKGSRKVVKLVILSCLSLGIVFLVAMAYQFYKNRPFCRG